MPNLRKHHMHSSSTMSVPRSVRFGCIADVRQSKISETLKPSAWDAWRMYIRKLRQTSHKVHACNKQNALETTACNSAAGLMIRWDDGLFRYVLSTLLTSTYKLTAQCFFYSSCNYAFSIASWKWRQIRAEVWKNWNDAEGCSHRQHCMQCPNILRKAKQSSCRSDL